MSEHTKEPWAIHPVSSTSVVGGTGFVVAACGGHTDNTRNPQDVHDELTGNARRIVACVNACAGYSTEELENHPAPIITKLLNERDQAEQQREACAKVCLDEANKQWAAFEAEKTDYLEGRADSADYLWQKMRSNA